MDQCSVGRNVVRGPFSTLRGQTVGGGNVRILDAAPLISATAMVKVFGCRQAYENLHLPGHRRTTPPIPEAVVRRAVCWRLSAPVERSGRGHIQSTAEHSVLYLIHLSEATEPHRPGRDLHGRLGPSLAAVADRIHATVFTGPARESYSFSRTLHYRGVPGSHDLDVDVLMAHPASAWRND